MMEVSCSTFGLPTHTLLLKHQIAGHCHGEGKTKLGMLTHESGDILKPIMKNDIRGIREIEFYKEISNSHCVDNFFLELKKFLPEYYGIWETDFEGSRVQYMRLQDITSTFQNPCIMDIKIGAQTFDPFASKDKILREKEKFSFMEEIAYRILGMRVYQNGKDDYLVLGKDFGKEQTPNTQVKALHLYFDNQTGSKIKGILLKFIAKLESIEDWFQRQAKLSFYSSSLLLVYEAKSLLEDIATDQPVVDVRMIDFAHVFPTTEKDENYIRGLRSLIDYLTKVLEVV